MSYQKLLKTLREELNKLESCVVQGQIPDFPSYRFYVGQIKGLQDAIDISKATFKEDYREE